MVYSKSQPVVYSNSKQIINPSSNISYIEDYGHTLTLEDILREKDVQLSTNDNKILNFRLSTACIWLKFSVENRTDDDNLYIEIANPNINEVSFYSISTEGINIAESGTNHSFEKRKIKNNLFLFKLHCPARSSCICVIKIKSDEFIQLPLFIGTLETFLEEHHKTDFLDGILYGVLILMTLYNLFIYIRVRDKVYIYYVLFTLFTTLVVAYMKGSGYEFLWNYAEWFNKYFMVIVFFAGLYMILFSMEFLKTAIYYPRLHKLAYSFIACYAACLVLKFNDAPFIANLLIQLTSIGASLYFFVLSLMIYVKGYHPSKYYFMGWLGFLSGVVVTTLYANNLLPYDILTVNSLSLGTVVQVLLLSFALADRINEYKKEKEEAQKQALLSLQEKEAAQQETIIQLKETEQIKEQLGKQLEEKVKERTKELEDKNQQLDAFVYKASHDIKGPLRSIIGLTSVGMKDVKEEAAQTYFKHILKSTKKLDEVLADFLHVTRVKELKLENSSIGFKPIFEDILKSFQNLPEFKYMKFDIQVHHPDQFYSDPKVLYSISQNLIENAIKYRDPNKASSVLAIKVFIENNCTIIEFTDNGLGVAPEDAEKIFDMFYKVNESSNGTGLGLHIVKMSVERIGGKITLTSELGKYSCFRIEFPRTNPT